MGFKMNYQKTKIRADHLSEQNIQTCNYMDQLLYRNLKTFNIRDFSYR